MYQWEDQRLRALEKTGYEDGGMSPREERLWAMLDAARDAVRDIRGEWEEAEEFCQGAKWLSQDQKSALLETYREKLEAGRREARLIREALCRARDAPSQ